MTAPTRTRPAPQRRASRTTPTARPRISVRSAAAQRAYSRKTERTQRWKHLVPDPLSNVAVVKRVPFVVLVIGLLGLGLVATLWLSTNAAEGSYQLSNAQKDTRLLSEKAEALHRDVATMASAAALARRASELGMVPTTDVARLVVGPDGAVTVVGKPTPAAPPAVVLPLPPAPQGGPVPAPNPAPAAIRAPAAPTAPAATPAPAVLPAPAVPPAPALGAPAQPAGSAQAHSEQIQPGPIPGPARGGA